MATVTVRDTLSGSTYSVSAESILRTHHGRLARDNWHSEEVVREAASASGAEAWAPADDGGEERYLPVDELVMCIGCGKHLPEDEATYLQGEPGTYSGPPALLPGLRAPRRARVAHA